MSSPAPPGQGAGDRSRGLVTDTALLALGSALAAVLGLVGLRLIVTGLSEADYGRYGLFLALGSGATAVLLSWPIPSVLRLGAEEVEESGQLGRTFGSIVALVLGSLVVAGTLAYFGRGWIDLRVEHGATPYVVALGALSALAMLTASLLQPAGRVGLRTLFPAGTRALYLVALAIAWLPAQRLALDDVLLLCGLTAVPGALAPLLLVRARLARPAVDARVVARAARFGWPLLLREAGLIGLPLVDLLLIDRFLGKADVGRYDLGARLAEQVVVFGLLLGYVAGPVLAAAAARGDHGTLGRYFRLAMPPLVAAWSLGAALLVVLAEPVVSLLGSRSPEVSAEVFRILLLAVAIRGVATLEAPVLDAHLLSAWPTTFFFAGFLANFALDVVVLGAGAGVTGSAWGTVAGYALTGVLRSAYLARTLGVSSARPYLGVLPLVVVLVVAQATDGAVGPALLAWGVVAVALPAAGRRLGLFPPETREALAEVRMPRALRGALARLYESGRGPPRSAGARAAGAAAPAAGAAAPAAGAAAPSARRRRLLLLTTELHPGGAERVICELATRLPPERYEVTVASLRSPGGDDGAVARELTAAGVDVVSLRLRGKLDLAGALRLAALVRWRRPDVLHAHLFHANVAARVVGRLAGARRVVSTLHVVERRALPLRFAVERLTAALDDRTVCVSRAVARFARARLGVRASRLRVVTNGIELPRYATPIERAAARAAFDLPADALVVGAVGRLSPQKGHDDLLAAFAAVPAPAARLVIAGQGELEAALRARAAALGLEARVRFLGFQEDVPRVLAALDVFCMPSRWEGFGLALAEALAAGKPCVASAVDSLPEVMGDAGLLVPPGDPAALAAALTGLLEDPARRDALSRRARARAERFGVEAMVSAYEQVYDELLGEGR